MNEIQKDVEFCIIDRLGTYTYPRLVLLCHEADTYLSYESISDNFGKVIPDIKKVKIKGSKENVDLFMDLMEKRGLKRLLTGNPMTIKTEFIPGGFSHL